MGITVGLMITVVSIVGIAGCIAGLLMTGTMFKRQREQMLEEIERE